MRFTTCCVGPRFGPVREWQVLDSHRAMEGVIRSCRPGPGERSHHDSKGRRNARCRPKRAVFVDGVNVASRKNALTHVDTHGRARMVDVTEKSETVRVARAEAFVEMSPMTVKLLRDRALPKGNPLEVARIAGIQAAKKTSELIPLCHPLPLTHLDVLIEITDRGARIESAARTKAETGVEMEAMTAASVAALTLYDMCKAVEKGISIGPVRLLEKSGGKSGHWKRTV